MDVSKFDTIAPYACDDPLPYLGKRWDRFARPQFSTFLVLYECMYGIKSMSADHHVVIVLDDNMILMLIGRVKISNRN